LLLGICIFTTPPSLGTTISFVHDRQTDSLKLVNLYIGVLIFSLALISPSGKRAEAKLSFLTNIMEKARRFLLLFLQNYFQAKMR
jgi:hypothetical protein